MIKLNTKRITLSEQALFFKRLGMLLRAGTPLLETLRLLRSQSPEALIKIIDHSIDHIAQGKQLSGSLAGHPAFNPFVIQVLRIGETTGMLAENLAYVATELEQQQALRNKIITALLYPIIIVIATLVIIGVLVFYVLPKILPIFESLHVPLPKMTRLMLSVSTLGADNLLFIFASIAGLGLVTFFGLRHKKIKNLQDRWILTLPIVGKIVQSYLLINFCRTLGQLLRSNIPIMQATVITRSVFTNSVYRQQVVALGLALNHGQPLSVFFQQQPKLFPPLLAQLVAIGERTGTLDDNLMYAAKLYEQDILDLTNRLATLIEPSLMVVMGCIVGFVAISIITPVYEITQHLHG